MDTLLNKFSLQHFFRQFFCGVVFFAPMWIFSRGRCNCFDCFLCGQGWQISQLVILGVLACVVGTIIYHLEKNLWSYLIQFVFEKLKLGNLLDRTEKCWLIEARAKKQVDKNSLYAYQEAIADKVSTWSDFIHCTQSCCFAWILGSSVYQLWIEGEGNTPYIGNSYFIALAILILEVCIDAHRYQHVIRMTAGEKSIDEVRKAPDA